MQALKIKPEPEKPLLPKRPKDAKDAKEVARKLIKSGNINLPKNDTQSKFKRPNFSQERKKIQAIEAAYHPYSTPDTPLEKNNTEEESSLKSTVEKSSEAAGNRSISFLYQQVVQEKDTDKRQTTQPKESKPKSGFTVYVSGKSITEDFLKKHFSEFGTIVNVSMEIEKGRGFITFSKTEATSMAISEVR